MISFNCPVCSQRYNVPDNAAGKTAKCKKCGESLTIPLPKQTYRDDEKQGGSEESQPPGPGGQPTKLRTRIVVGSIVCGLVFVAVLVVLLSGNPDRDRQSGLGSPQGSPPPVPVKTWSPKLVRELKEAEETANELVTKDREMRQKLPMLAREEKQKLTTPETNMLRKFQELDIDRDFEARRVTWVNKMIEWQSKLAGSLLGLRKTYGMEDKKLADECSRIIGILSPTSDPWPSLH